MISIDEDILKGVELPPRSLLHAKGDLVVDIVLKIVECANGLINLVSVKDGSLEDSFDVVVEVGESETTLLCFFVRVYEED